MYVLGQGVSWERTYPVLSLYIYEHSWNILFILLSGDQIPHPFLWVFGLLFFFLYLTLQFIL